MKTITLPNRSIAYADLEQGTPEWHKIRAGVPTANRLKDIMTKPREKGATWSKTALTYAYELAGEAILGEPAEVIETFAMRRGKELENQLRADYAFIAEAEVTEIGFVRSGRYGASPDGLVGANGAVEFKTHLPKILIPMMLEGDEMPEQHKAQTQGQLLVTGREWVDLVAFWPGLPLFTTRVFRDEDYIAELAGRLEAFSDLVDGTVGKVRAFGEPTFTEAAE